MEDFAIKVENLNKSFKLPHEKQGSLKSSLINFKKRGYEIQQVLDDINFEIKKGEFFGIVGRNGSGKSTLLKLLAGIYKPDSGEVHVRGSLTPFIELGVGFNPELSGRENVYLNGALLGFNRKDMEAMYGDIVEFAELERFMDQKLKNYSSGMQVRLAFSIAIRAQSDILLLDEVLAVGDEAFQRKCYNYFKELKRNKKTVIIVTHDMSAIESFCTQAMVVSNGKILWVGDPEVAAEKYSELNAPKLSQQFQKSHTPSSKSSERKNLANVLIKSMNISSAKVTQEEEFTVQIEIKADESKKIVAGINLYKVNDEQNSCHAEYNSWVEKGDYLVTKNKSVTFEVRLKKGQLYKGNYIVKAHILDVDDNYKHYINDKEYKEFSVVNARKSKSGSFNISGQWEVK